jgi:hypothetical protein
MISRMRKSGLKVYKLYYYPCASEVYLSFKPSDKDLLTVAQDHGWECRDVKDIEVTRLVVYEK